MNEERKDDMMVESEEDIENVKEQIKEAIIDENTPTDAQNELFAKILKEATMPVEMNDGDFKLGDNELDVRKLNKKNQTQMFFRLGVLVCVYLKQILTTGVDVTRLLMVIADKLGVEDIVTATDAVIEKVTAKNQELKELMDREKDKNKA